MKKLVRHIESDLHRIVKESVNRILKEDIQSVKNQFSLTDDIEGRNKAIDLKQWLERKLRETEEAGERPQHLVNLIDDLDAFIHQDDFDFGEDWDEERNARFEFQHGY